MLEKMKKVEKMLKVQGVKTRICFDKRNSFGRDGRDDAWDIDDAVDSAIRYVNYYSNEGKFACVDILLYKETKEGWFLVESACIKSKFSGEYYENGYAKPVMSNEYEVKEF